MQTDKNKSDRRRLLTLFGGGAVLGGTTSVWVKPVVNSVVLPAHAQTSICIADTTVGGPLLGHSSGASTCQAACEAEATALSGQLCSATESLDATNATICSCEIDTIP